MNNFSMFCFSLSFNRGMLRRIYQFSVKHLGFKIQGAKETAKLIQHAFAVLVYMLSYTLNGTQLNLIS